MVTPDHRNSSVAGLSQSEEGHPQEREHQHHQPQSHPPASANNHGIDHHHPNQNLSEGHAEAIVRKAARTVRNLRAALVCLILAAATGCGILIYKLASKNESEAAKYSFDVIATKLTESFSNILLNNLNYAYLISVALSSGLYADTGFLPPFPNVSINQLDTWTNAVIIEGLISHLIWSPIIETRAKRKAWEAYAVSMLAKSETNSSSISGTNPPCYICGEGNDIADPNAEVDVPGVGLVKCRYVDSGYRTGYVSPEQCNYYSPIVKETCGCINGTTYNVTNATSVKHQVAREIFNLQDGVAFVDNSPPPYSPVWQIVPSLKKENIIMFNQMSEPWRRVALKNMLERKTPVFSKTMDPNMDGIYQLAQGPQLGFAASLYFPVLKSFKSSEVAGSLTFDFPWESLLRVAMPPNAEGVTVVLENTLGQMYTYGVKDSNVTLLGEGDLHDKGFDTMIVESSYDKFNKLLLAVTPRQGLNQSASDSIPTCSYRIRVYPSKVFEANHITNKPAIFTTIVVLAFGVTSLVFLAYDIIVRRIQTRVLDAAKRSEEIVSSMFPAVVRDRLFRHNTSQSPLHSPSRFSQWAERKRISFDIQFVSHRARLRKYLSQTPSNEAMSDSDSEPIADLFPNATVLFADIAGFTAWSSEREPTQVFKLLESLYSEFDRIARELGVFKVETIGDSYVAVTGLPETMPNHHIVMVDFAFRCLERMRVLVSNLELILGPGTADLTMRVGLHSGPVTAGVLRGERARFQLFGDTMNVASRMESTGQPEMIHISKETAQLLRDSGKEHWVIRRRELVSVKGKGELQTYWAKPEAFSDESRIGSSSNASEVDEQGTWGLGAKTREPSTNGRARLVEWTADLLQGLLTRIVAKHSGNSKLRCAKPMLSESGTNSTGVQFVDELTDMIEMPEFDENAVDDENSIDLCPLVRSQLKEYVSVIASLYRDNAFHNFEHACHVAMSASKLLKRIITPNGVGYEVSPGNHATSRKRLAKEVHETTFGISSDPLLQFAIVFSALIHDVDRTGVTNEQLVTENHPLAIIYNGKCVAEQRSLQLAWDTLMDTRFKDLRRCIYQTEEEKQRFRQLLVNAVIATDIADRDLGEWRKSRWDMVFHQEPTVMDAVSVRDRKATVVLEYIIQAADVAHTMQHWHVYQKWNNCLFAERYAAYLEGRESEDPSVGWHKGEIDFFDNYVIPLAKKLEECNVFGLSCDEHLSYALQNRHEWEVKGEDIVRHLVDCQPSGRSEQSIHGRGQAF